MWRGRKNYRKSRSKRVIERADPGLSLEEIYEFLETANHLVAALRRERRKSIPADELFDLSELVMELTEYSAIYPDNPLAISPSVLNKFKKFSGNIDTRTARLVADRIVSYLRSLDQKIGVQSFNPAPKRQEQESPAPRTGFIGERWVVVNVSSSITEKIADVSSILDSIIEQASRPNLPPGQLLLTDIQRRQLIAILETTLNVLKSPLVEKSLMRTAGKVLRKGAEAASQKGVEVGLGKLMGLAAEKLAELAKLLF